MQLKYGVKVAVSLIQLHFGTTVMKMNAQHTINYQSVLRAIGQGLETLKAKCVELEVSDGQFVVSGQGETQTTRDASKSNLKKGFLSLVFSGANKRTAQQKRCKPFHFSGITFGPTDIEFLEWKGNLSQTNHESCPPTPHKLSQILRTVGYYLDRDECTLRKLSWRNGVLTLWRTNTRGVESKEILSPEALYDHWVHQYKKRKPTSRLKRTGND